MGLDCGGKCLKVTLIIFNVLFWLCGAAMLGLGIWLAVDDDAFDTLDILNPDGMDFPIWQAAVYTMIGVGAFVFLVGFLGWLGACMENNCMLLTYTILAGVALIGEIVCAVLAIVFRDSIDDGVAQQMFEDIRDEYSSSDPDNSYTTSWDRFQSKMRCCGSYNYTDWHKNPDYGPAKTPPVPWTCCQMREISNPPEPGDVISVTACYSEGRNSNPNDQPSFSFLNNIGCHRALKDWIRDKSAIIFGVMFGFMAVQILGIIFGCVLRCQLD